MLDAIGSYGEELKSLEAAYEQDNEGLSYKEYFNKYASEDYKRFTEETIRQVDDAWKHGIAI